MKKKPLKIGNAQGFWGDSVNAPYKLLSQQPDLDYLTLDYLSEVSMSILAIQKEKDPALGYARDFVEVVKSLIPLWEKGSHVKIIANAGGLNPSRCALTCMEVLRQFHCRKTIGIVSGDDILSLLTLSDDPTGFLNLDTGESLNVIREKLVTANAYLGAKPIVEALNWGADIVITGRVADPSLTVAPCIAHFGWACDDFNFLAGATVAGHLIECGTQVTGGISTNWLEVPNPADIGFPFVEVGPDGSFIVTKPDNSGGIVNLETVKEQLLYEIGDPEQYLSPDAIVSFLSLKLEEKGKNRIRVSGAIGKAPPPTYKVSATFRDGYKAEGWLSVFGSDAYKKARYCGEIILEKVKKMGYVLDRSLVECLGTLDVVPGIFDNQISSSELECVLRVSAASSKKEALECFVKEIAPMVTSGPQGVVGYTSGRPKIRPVFGYWPCLVDCLAIVPKVEILEY